MRLLMPRALRPRQNELREEKEKTGLYCLVGCTIRSTPCPLHTTTLNLLVARTYSL